jgi:hypothetical protein
MDSPQTQLGEGSALVDMLTPHPIIHVDPLR